MKKFLLAFPVAGLFAVLVVLTAPNDRWPTTVHACSDPYPSIEYFMREAEAVAVVKAVAVGGPDNAAPTQMPDPRVFVSPRPGTPIISLEGIGATLRLEELLDGSMPAMVKVGEGQREGIERGIRYLEANPSYVAPCDLDFGLHRWSADARYVVFLERDDDGRWSAALRYQIAGSDVIVGHGGDGHPPLIMNDGLYQAHFGGLAAQGYFDDKEPWNIKAKAVPLQALLAAVRDMKDGLFPLPTEIPEEDSPKPPPRAEQRGRITPPTTGDGGLR